jgi:hypothetical protein
LRFKKKVENNEKKIKDFKNEKMKKRHKTDWDLERERKTKDSKNPQKILKQNRNSKRKRDKKI